jgi:hypothetical protein
MYPFKNFQRYSIAFIMLFGIVMSVSTISCGLIKTGSSIPKQESISESEWIGNYHGTATLIEPKRVPSPYNTDYPQPRKIGREGEIIDVRIVQDIGNIILLELNFAKNQSFSNIYGLVQFHLELSALSSQTISVHISNKINSDFQYYSISLKRDDKTITGEFSGGSLREQRSYILNLEKIDAEK